MTDVKKIFKHDIDILIYDVSKCFDKLEYVNTANDLYTAGIKNDNFILVANSNKSCDVAIKMPWGSLSEKTKFTNIEMQGTVLAPLKCSIMRLPKRSLPNRFIICIHMIL